MQVMYYIYYYYYVIQPLNANNILQAYWQGVATFRYVAQGQW